MTCAWPAVLLLLGVPAVAVDWPVAPPQAEGFDPIRLEALRRNLAARNTRALLVARHGRIVLEWYGHKSGPEVREGTASLAKALVGGMSLLVGLEDGRISADDRASKYIRRWRSDPQKNRITIRQLATHTSGIDDAELDELPHDKLPGWKGDFWKRQPDPISIALDQAPVVFEPGTKYLYSNPGMGALSYAITASLRGTAAPDVRSALARRVLEPIGVDEHEWRISYGEVYEPDGMRIYANWGGANFTARAAARVGQLMLQQGRWAGRPLFRGSLVKRVTGYAGMPVDVRLPR
jgi:CubicO group peptidase (beta-lactamase class C family)